uniref:Uncharacterized protein n=1 Tax=Arundo donax TaxID=35708 RepID=A0A0A9C1C4_ARUDO
MYGRSMMHKKNCRNIVALEKEQFYIKQ